MRGQSGHVELASAARGGFDRRPADRIARRDRRRHQFGAILRLAFDSGNVLSQINLGQPLALGPAVWHERLLLVGGDGTLHIVAEPK